MKPFVPEYPALAELETGSTVTPPDLIKLFGRSPSKADLLRLRARLESRDSRLVGRIVIADGMLTVISPEEGIRRRLKFAAGSAKASVYHASRGSEIDTSRLSPIDRKRADLEQMALQRHAVTLAGAVENLAGLRLPPGGEKANR